VRVALTRQAAEHIHRATVYGTPAALPRLPDSSELDLTLFVPCYNEEENIVGTLEEIARAMVELDFSWEVIVIDDASQDGTVPLVLAYMEQHQEMPLTLVVREENEGVAHNYIEGAFLGRGRYYKLVNGDNVETGSQLVALLRHIGEAEILIPYHQNVITTRTLYRRFLSRLFTLLVNLVGGFRLRYYNGCGVNLRYNIMRWNTTYHGFGFQADLITKLLAQGKSYREIPVIGMERQTGTSKAMTLKNFFSVLHFFIDLAILRIGRVFCKRERKSA
jgi:glycosyltransferase involved in cell wall biosynthesis